MMMAFDYIKLGDIHQWKEILANAINSNKAIDD